MDDDWKLQILNEIMSNYPFGQVDDITLLKNSLNIHYLISSNHVTYVLRIYKKNFYSSPEIHELELDYLRFIKNGGGHVAAPIAKLDGTLLHMF